jgi:UDP-N-acetyl-2-amino-2-deoxyglucuronate dehydrogenase
MLKFALVGCGRIAKRHADLLSNGEIRNASLCAVSEINPQKLEEFKRTYGVPGYECYNTMMSRENPDVVVVLTESGNHAKHVIELANFGKHIVVEKPMALRLGDADKMIEACDAQSIKLFVVKQNRFNLPILKLKEALDQERFGKLVLGSIRVRWCREQSYYDQDAWRGTWSMDGGVLTNQASHHLDMLQWMMGEVKEVYAIGATQLANIETEDTAVAVLKFVNGALGSVEATTAARPKDQEGSISILGENGLVEVGGFAMNEIKTWAFSKTNEDDTEVMRRYSVNPPNVYGFGHREYYQHVVRSITNNGPNIIDGIAGRKSLELINAIYESMESRKPIAIRYEPRSQRLGGGLN